MSDNPYAYNLESLINKCLEYVDEKKILVVYYKENYGFTESQRFERFTRPIIGAFRPLSLIKKPKYTDNNRENVIKEEVDILMDEYYKLKDDCEAVLQLMKNSKMDNDLIMHYYQKFALSKKRLFIPSINDLSAAKLLGWKTIFGRDIS